MWWFSVYLLNLLTNVTEGQRFSRNLSIDISQIYKKKTLNLNLYMTLLNELQFKFTLPQKTLFTSSNNIVILEIDQYFTVLQENSYGVKFQLAHSFLTDSGGNYLCIPL